MRNIIQTIRQSLSWKLSLGIMLMAIPIFGLALGILSELSREDIKNEATKHAASMLNTAMQRFSRYLEMAQTATDINDWQVTANLNPDSLRNLSHYIIAFNGHVDGCWISTEPEVFPEYGRLFSAYTVRKPDTIITSIDQQYDYSMETWYKKPSILGKPCWTVFSNKTDHLSHILDEVLATYSKPLYDANNRLVAVIATDLSLRRLSNDIMKETPYKDSYFIMTGEEGRFCLHPDSTKIFNETIFSGADPKKNSDIFALGYEMTTGKQGTMSVKIDGKKCLVSYQPVPGTEWSLALVCPERSILQNYNRLPLILTPLIIIGMLLILLFSIITVAHAIRPLNKLTEKIRRISAGHYDEQINISQYSDTVGRLQNTFAAMQRSLSTHVRNIQQMNEEAAKRNDELVRTSELARIADHQKAMFIQNVSHQIRTPLNIIMGFSQVLKDSKNIMPDEEAKGISDMIKQNANKLYRMVIMLYDSSVRSLNKDFRLCEDDIVSCNEIARESIASIEEYFPDVPMNFKSEVADSLTLHTNRLYLKRILRELLFNACKYSDCKNIWLRVSENESLVRFTVEDTGPGIADEYASQLFELFSKSSDLTEGLGIGLPLTRRHVQDLGGEIRLDTDYKDGCRFIIEFSKT